MQFVCEPLSRNNLRQYATNIRKATGTQNMLAFPVVEFLEAIPELFNDGFSYEIVEDNQLPPNVHAEYDIVKNCISIKQFVYDGACNNCGRDRLTIMHEIAHYFLLSCSGIKFYRSTSQRVPPYRDPEWQATCLAAEILMPRDKIYGMTVEEISQTCHVSKSAACYQLQKI